MGYFFWCFVNTEKLLILIPAIKKNVAFEDDLVKKIAGVSLLQRSINLAKSLDIDSCDIFILTDSEEIALIANRNNVECYIDSKLIWNEDFFYKYIKSTLINRFDYSVILSPYAPLLNKDIIINALKTLKDSKELILKPILNLKRKLYINEDRPLYDTIFNYSSNKLTVESNAFLLLKNQLLQKKNNLNYKVLPWKISSRFTEINTFQDWWVCEKLIMRKRFVFRVIGNNEVGMGHIYRSLALAHSITDHEIIFVCDFDNRVAVNELAGYDYRLEVFKKNEIIKNIIKLNPDLLVNDILSTRNEDVVPFQDIGIKVVNFEDLGEGALKADLTINELYENPHLVGKNIFWGHKYFFLREEFNNAKKHNFEKKIDQILLAFGGTDQLNLSSICYHLIKDLCKKKNIIINIVTGPGYENFEKLKSEVSGNNLVTLTRSTGVISSIMEKSQIAIISNGRTVYELAHLNIPAIVISQHEREETHEFAREKFGFIPISIFKKDESEKKIFESLSILIEDVKFRKKLFEKTSKYDFSYTKDNVLNHVIELLSIENNEE